VVAVEALTVGHNLAVAVLALVGKTTFLLTLVKVIAL
jgi:hypothetical protein